MIAPPRKQPIDDFLWPRVATIVGYLEMVVLIGLFMPILVGSLVPFTPEWVTVYAIVVVGCVSCGGVVHASRERLLAWRSWAALDGEACRVADAKQARRVVDQLIRRDLEGQR